METRSDEPNRSEQVSKSAEPRNGASEAASSANGPSDLALRYMDELRARRRMEPPGGLRIFNPDETLEEREIRIRETLAGLKRLQVFAAAGTEEDGRI